MTFLTRKQLQERKKQQLRERKKQRRHERKERQLQERKEHQLQARQKQQQFIAEFVRRLREVPDGTRVYMRCGDVFAPLTGCDDDDDDAAGHSPRV